MKSCTPLWRKAHLEVKMLKTHYSILLSDHVWKLRVEKVHAVVARSTLPSQNVQNASVSEHFWKFRCRKSARHCGAKHIAKSTMLKTDGLGAFLEVQMLEKCTPLWREAHCQVKSAKNWRVRSTFGSSDVEKVHAIVARSTLPSQKCKKLKVSEHFWKFRCWKSARRCGAKHIAKSKVLKTEGLGALLEVQMLKKCTPLWREAHFEVKTPHVWTTFGRSDVLSRGRRKGFSTLPKGSKTWGFCGISKNDGSRGTFEEDLERCISRGRRNTRDSSALNVHFWRKSRRIGSFFMLSPSEN